MSAAERLRAVRGTHNRYRVDRRVFERIVSEIVRTLPEQFRGRLENVAIVVEDWPTDDEHEGAELLGLYHGVPYGERLQGYNLAVPDRITIYRQPILATSRSEAAVREEIRLTVLHEIGHYFGLGEDDLP